MIFLLGQHSTLKQNCFSSNYNEFFSAGKWVVVLRFFIFWSTLSMHGDDDNLKMIRCAWVKASPKLNFFSFSQFWFVPHQSDHHNHQFDHHIKSAIWHSSTLFRHPHHLLQKKILSGEEVPLRRLRHPAPSWPCQLPYWHHKVWSLSAINSIVTFFLIFSVTISTEVINTIIALHWLSSLPPLSSDLKRLVSGYGHHCQWQNHQSQELYTYSSLPIFCLGLP